jgi:hypothetical protein
MRFLVRKIFKMKSSGLIEQVEQQKGDGAENTIIFIFIQSPTNSLLTYSKKEFTMISPFLVRNKTNRGDGMLMFCLLMFGRYQQL